MAVKTKLNLVHHKLKFKADSAPDFKKLHEMTLTSGARTVSDETKEMVLAEAKLRHFPSTYSVTVLEPDALTTDWILMKTRGLSSYIVWTLETKEGMILDTSCVPSI